MDFDQVKALLVAARKETSGARARTLLLQALAMVQDSAEQATDPESVVLCTEVCRDLAWEGGSASERIDWWNKGIRIVQAAAQKLDHVAVLAADAFLSVDYAQDAYAEAPLDLKQAALRASRDRCSRASAGMTASHQRSVLLARKSALLRQLALLAASNERQYADLQEAVRCANRAVEDDPDDASGLLELGMAEWYLARHQSTDQDYADHLRQAEEHLVHAARDERLEAARFGLARFYRMTFQPLRACEAFSVIVSSSWNTRRLFRESSAYAEAATQLWYGDYPPDVVRTHLVKSQELAEGALAAGYVTARTVVALAFLRGAMEGPQAGSAVLVELGRLSKKGAWTDIVSTAQAALLDPGASPAFSTLGLVMGLDSSAVWTRLGTFALNMMDDVPLAEQLYETAVRLGPHDAIALTNMARLLLRKGDASRFHEAQRLLQRASNFADRRFRWWRAVKADLDSQMRAPEGASKKEKARKGAPKSILQMQNIRELRQEFRRIEENPDAQRRGYALETLVCRLAQITCGEVRGPYKIPRGVRSADQIDGFIRIPPEKYRVECKWQKDPSDHTEISAFSAKLDVVGISGLFVSIAGFTDHAEERAKEERADHAILLMDGDELRHILDGNLNFDQAILRKHSHFDADSQVYHRVVEEPVYG